MTAEDRGRDVSYALTEVRTVLSRAETALSSRGAYSADPDGDEIRADLEAVVEQLSKWRRTGKTPTEKCSRCGRASVGGWRHKRIRSAISGDWIDCPEARR